MHHLVDDLRGRRFGRLVVVARDYADKRHNAAKWKCLCDCGKSTIQRADVLKSKGTMSCGCLATEKNREHAYKMGALNRRHGHTTRKKSSPEYSSWLAMKARCMNPSNIHYDNYGGRGITVCERWMCFENFIEDMGARPAGHTLDRIDFDGNYEPTNCRWATVTQQNRNRSDNNRIEFEGRTKTLSEWAEIYGVRASTINLRITKLGWPIGKALTTPTRSHRKH